MFDLIVLGSGPAGVAAALQAEGSNVLVTDVGNRPTGPGRLNDNFYGLRQNDEPLFEELIGPEYESLNNIDNPYLMPKLKAPLQRYIVSGAERFGNIRSDTFSPVQSFAQGGLANAWGAQLYRFSDTDLSDYPVTLADLEPYYDRLTAHIGIAGEEDDLTPFYGSTRGLLPPLRLNKLGNSLIERYKRHRKHFQRRGIAVGRPRLAVLTRDHEDRKACTYENLEFFKPRISAVYTPAYTLEKLIRSEKVTYHSGYYAESFKETDRWVEVRVRHVESGDHFDFRARRLVLALGAISTARFVLRSRNDFSTQLPFVDNLLSYIPFLDIRQLGSSLETSSFYTQLNLVYQGPKSTHPVMGTFYSISGILHGDVLFDIPLTLPCNIKVSKYLLPALFVLHLWYPGDPRPESFLRINDNGDVSIRYQGNVDGMVERHLIASFRRIGYLSHYRLCRFPEAGNSFHYAGTLPMRKHPKTLYETFPDGKLNGTRYVYVVDGSVLPNIPAKNLSFTVMANAMRITEHALRSLQGYRT